MTRAGAALALIAAVVILPTVAGAGGSGIVATGFIEGREHEVRIRPVLAEVPPVAKKVRQAARATGEAAIASCDPAQVTPLGKQAPTTARDGDGPTACVVLVTADDPKADRLMLGPAPLTGSEIGGIVPAGARKKNLSLDLELTARGNTLWAFFGTSQTASELAVTLDGEVLGLVTMTSEEDGSTSFNLGGKQGFPKEETAQLEHLFEQAALEEIIELARAASMSRRGLKLFATNAPAIEEKNDFATSCPLPEADAAFVLGCYDHVSHDIEILRIDRLDIIGAMTVTAAHEMLHAAYDGLTPSKRERVDTLIDELIFTTPQPQLEESLALYSEAERADELHSLLGTEVGVLSPELERYYARYFDDRSVVVTLNAGYQAVFDDLENRFAQLEAELNALEAQLNSVASQADAAGNEANRLGAEFDSLLAQGRFDEANALVGPQNAAVDRANSLTSQYNSLVSQFNAKVDEINAIAASLGELYQDVTAKPIA